jgi:hypothetical protein
MSQYRLQNILCQSSLTSEDKHQSLMQFVLEGRVKVDMLNIDFNWYGLLRRAKLSTPNQSTLVLPPTTGTQKLFQHKNHLNEVCVAHIDTYTC